MATTITIDERFRGPPNSVNGGYACGVTATALTDGPAEVTLRLPPPIGEPLRLETSDDRSALYDGASLVAEARPADLDLDVPEAVPLSEAEDAARRFDVETYHAMHAFPNCFTCGPAREPGQGLRIFPAPVERPTTTIAWPWEPDDSVAADDGLVDPKIMWAALDCPSGLVWIFGREEPLPAVLGRMTADVQRRPSPGERLVAGAWALGAEGRRLTSGSAIWGRDGEVLARALATWIVLTEEQIKSFEVAGQR